MNLKQKNFDKIKQEFYQAINPVIEQDEFANEDDVLSYVLERLPDDRLGKIYEFVFDKIDVQGALEDTLQDIEENRQDLEYRTWFAHHF